MGSIFQSFINNAPNLVFDTMKPFMLKDAYAKLKTEIDTNVEKLMGDKSLPNSISPLDMAIAEGRNKIREMGYDPFIVRNYNHSVGMFSIQLSNTWISGVSSFYRVGDIIASMVNNTVTLGMCYKGASNSLNFLGRYFILSFRATRGHTSYHGLNAMGNFCWQRNDN